MQKGGRFQSSCRAKFNKTGGRTGEAEGGSRGKVAGEGLTGCYELDVQEQQGQISLVQPTAMLLFGNSTAIFPFEILPLHTLKPSGLGVTGLILHTEELA